MSWQGTGSINKTDLFTIHNIVQNTQIWYPKELVIGILRDFFSQDSYYHYVADPWGFPLTPDHTDLPSESGLHDDSTTRLYVGENYRFDVIYYSAIIVRNAGTQYVPISFNRNKENVLNKVTMVIDGYGNQKLFFEPTHFTLAGAWEGSINIDIITRGIRERDDLVELAMLCCTDIRFEEFLRAGLLMKRVSAGAPSETEDRNDKLYRQTVTLDVRSEWRRHIPVGNIIDRINICVDFGNLQNRPFIIAPNIEINTSVELVDQINAL